MPKRPTKRKSKTGTVDTCQRVDEWIEAQHGKFEKATFSVSWYDEMIKVVGTRCGALALWHKDGKWRTVHTPTGALMGTPITLKEEAKKFVRAIGPLADWEQFSHYNKPPDWDRLVEACYTIQARCQGLVPPEEKLLNALMVIKGTHVRLHPPDTSVAQTGEEV